MMELIDKGGYLMFPLILCSILAIAIAVERIINLRRRKVVRPESAGILDNLIEEGSYEKAEAICRKNSWPYSRIVLSALESREMPLDDVKGAVADAGRHEVPVLERYLGTLSTIASISPLLGLLGTVVGMIKVFTVISSAGVGQAQALSEGISEALITTAVGLCVAIPTLIFHNYFRDKAETIILEMEARSMALIRCIKPGNNGGDKK